MVATKEFKIRVRQIDYVVPIHHNKINQNVPLSNLDLLLPPEHVGVFFCYRNSNSSHSYMSFDQMVSTLKMALAKVLVHFYLFSSKLVHNSLGEVEINCDNKGVEFIEAYGDVELTDINFYNPNESVEGKLLPKKQQRVFSVQATELKCGGMVLGCIFDHRVADAYSANMLFVFWAEIANSSPISMVPYFRKSLLEPRNPLSYNPSLNHMYIPISSLTPTKTTPLTINQSNPLISRIYKVNSKEINNLQSQAQGTKFESFSAFLWKLISKHATIMEDDKSNSSSRTCKMGIVVDGRTRLSNNNNNNNDNDKLYSDFGKKESMFSCYFGNVISLPFSEKTVCDLNVESLNQVAQKVHECLSKATSKDHFEDLIDWVQVHRPTPCLAKMYSQGIDYGPAFVVSSGQRFPISKIDFGWGKPVFGSYHFPWNGNAGYVMPMPSSLENGDWIVYMLLTEGQLKFIENEASNVFKPFKLFSEIYQPRPPCI